MALEFNGTNQSVNCGNDASLSVTDNFTIVCRIYWPADSAFRQVVVKANIVAGSYQGWDVLQMNDNKCRFEVLWTPSNVAEILSDAAIGAGEHLIIIVRDSGTSRMYVDNVLQAATMVSAPAACANNFYIGVNWNASTWFWPNLIYEIRLYAYPFSAAEVASVYYGQGADNLTRSLGGRWLMNEKPDGGTATAASSVIDISGNGNNGSPTNSPVYRAAPVRLVRPDLTMARIPGIWVFEESLALKESLPTIERQLTLEEAIALKESIDTPACADVVLEEAIALAESFPAAEQTIVRATASTAFLAEQAKRSNVPAKRIWLYINSSLYDITDKLMNEPMRIDRKMTYKPGETLKLTISDQNLVMSNVDKYFSDLNPSSPFYDRDYAGVDQIKVYAGFIIPSTGYAEVLQKADMKLISIELATKEAKAFLTCQDSFREVFDIYVGMPDSDGTPNPLIYTSKTFKYIMDDLLINKAGMPSAKVDIEDVSLTFSSISFEKKKVVECVQKLSEVARGNTVVLGHGTVQFRKFISEATDVDLVMRSGENYSRLRYTGQDFLLKVNKVVVIGATGVYAEAETPGETGMTLKYENDAILTDAVAGDVASECLGRFAVHPAKVVVEGEYLPSLDLKSIIKVYEPNSMMAPKIFQIRELALDIVKHQTRMLLSIPDSAGRSKVWSTTADWESGTLVNLIVPEDDDRLELKRLNLTGTGTFIFDAGAGLTANWIYFNSSKPNQNIYFRDDFRDNNLEAWTIVGGTWQAVSQYLKGTGSVDWTINRIRADSTSWAGQDILFKGYLSSGAESHRLFLRAAYGGITAYMLAVTGVHTEQARISNGSILENTVISSNHISKGCWYWFRIQIFNSGGNVVGRIKWWQIGQEESGGWKASHTWSGIWRSAGCFSVGRHIHDPGQFNAYDDILISRQEGVPSPPNCSVTFQFATSDNNVDWSAWTDDISNCADSRYIKIKATFSRNDLLSAMPTLEDMTVGYFLKG